MGAIEHDYTLTKPDYGGGSIVNLMRSIGDSCGVSSSHNTYPPVPGLGETLDRAQRIVLLVIDGFGLELLYAIGGNTIFETALRGQLTSVYPPTTASAITTFMSGQAPQQHGLTGWFMHFRHLGAVTAVLPFVPRFGSRSLVDSGVDIAEIIDCASFFDALDDESVVLLPESICDSEFSQLLGGRARRQPYASLDNFSDQLEDCCTSSDETKFVYAYWSDFDRLCHIHGPSSDVVAGHLDELNRALTRVFEACKASGTVLIATADHGFIDSGPNERVDLVQHPKLADMLSLPLCGEPRSAYCYVRSKCVNAFENYIENEFHDYAKPVPSSELIRQGWYGIGSPHPELEARIGDYTLQMKENYTISDCVAGERRHRMEGVHGGTSASEMFVPLMIAGP
jgi:hypothetical protein